MKLISGFRPTAAIPLDQGICVPCPLGTFRPGNSSNGCLACEAESYGNEIGLANCKSCPLGSFQSEMGQSYCLCEVGKYKDPSDPCFCLKMCDFCLLFLAFLRGLSLFFFHVFLGFWVANPRIQLLLGPSCLAWLVMKSCPVEPLWRWAPEAVIACVLPAPFGTEEAKTAAPSARAVCRA